jgi:alpha-L-rhamnosidase
VRPAGAYLYHHVVHAMLLCGMRDRAAALIREYWGAMLRRGASTFWEVFDPRDEKLSPYHNHLINSYCHAWSCTPTWFVRKWLCASV